MPRAFDSATWQAGASSDRGIHKTNQYMQSELSELTYIIHYALFFLPHKISLESVEKLY